MNDTDGWGVGSCDATAIWVGREAPGLGEAEVAWNEVLRTNGTGIRACGAKALTYVHNNTLVNERLVDAGITLHGGAGGILRVENNTVSGYEMGIWVKATYTPHDIARNVLTNNTDGIRVGYGDAAFTYAWAAFHNNEIQGNAVGVNVSTADWMDPQGNWYWYAGKADLYGNTITGNGRGVQVGVFVTHVFSPPPSPSWVLVQDRNLIQDNAGEGVYLRGKVVGGALISAWANVTGNNTISGNAYGVWIDGPTVDPTAGRFWMWWNDVRGNANGGVYVNGDPQGQWGSQVFFHAYCNWWDDANGPNDPLPGNPDTNPNPPGQYVSDYFWYRELNPPPPPYVPKGWLNRTSSDTLAACNGGV